MENKSINQMFGPIRKKMIFTQKILMVQKVLLQNLFILYLLNYFFHFFGEIQKMNK